MSDVQELLEELAGDGQPRGAGAVFDGATHEAARYQRKRRRRNVQSALVGFVVAAIAVTAVARAASSGHGLTAVRVGGAPTTTTTVPAATAAQLAAGHWSTIPAAPLGPRDNESEVWTGTELIVWGGEAQRSGRPDVMLGNGAAYDPATRAWRVLPPAPLSPRAGAVAVWTGSEMVLWGGTDAQQAAADATTLDPQARAEQVAVAYQPATNSWRSIGVVPLPTGSYASGVWTGDRVVLFAGRSAAAYDPSTNAWQLLPAPPVVRHLPGFRLEELPWRLAVAAGPGRIVAWSQWEATKQISAEESEGAGGADLFVYDEATNRWTAVATAKGAIPGPEAAFWTGGSRLLVRGDVHIPGASGPGPTPEASDWYDVATGTVTALPSSAMEARFLGYTFVSAWTGAALFSFEPGSVPAGSIVAAAYDPASNTWSNLPAAPSGCNEPAPPVWTGTSVLVYCAENSKSSLEYVSGTAGSRPARAQPPQPATAGST